MGGRDDLLAGAKKCLSEQGWGAPTVRDIAAAAGMSHAAIGYHFGSRDALMTEALVEAVGELGRQVERSTGQAGSEQRWQALLDTVGSHRGLWLAQLEAIRHAQHSEQTRDILRTGQHRAQDGLGGAIAQALLLGMVLQTLVDPSTAVQVEQVPAALDAVTRQAP